MFELSLRIRVLEVVRPSLGGMKKHVRGLVKGLDKDRFEVFLAAPKDEVFNQWGDLEGVEHIPLEISGRRAAPSDMIACLKLRKLIKTVRPDICHFHGFKAAAIGRLAVALCSLSAPLELRWHRETSTAGRWASNPQVVYTVHNSVLSRLDTRGKFCLYTEHALSRFTDRIIAVSKGIYQEYSCLPRVGPEKIRHIPNGIDLEQFRPTARFMNQGREQSKKAIGCISEIPVVGLVSRLIPDKGIKTFLVAIAALRRMGFEPQVLIAGDGPSGSELKAFAGELGIAGQVRFLGFIDDMVSFYEALDVFVLSSFSEGMPLAVIEAMAIGVPVVATKTGGVAEIVAIGDGGAEDVVIPAASRLVAPGDPEAMAACIRDVLLYPEESRSFADRARLYINENFSLEEMVRKTERVYEEVLACPGREDPQQ